MSLFRIIFSLSKDYLENLFVSKINRNLQLFYIVENADWAIKRTGENIVNNLNKINNLRAKISTTHFGLKNKIIHFGSVNTFFREKDFVKPHKSNKVVLTWFHVVPEDKRIKLISKAIKFIDVIHTSCNITKNRLVIAGIPKKKIVIIPLGIDISFFRPIANNKNKLKKRLNIPLNKVVIGSFQKDGEGWSKGLKPKLIKGPDIFVNVVKEISKEFDIHVLLSGPARGYIKKELEKNNISYTHKYLRNYLDIVSYYSVLDLYLVTSREEGGPLAILEAMACGVPLVSTKIGMASDVLTEGKNAMLCDVNDVKSLVKKSKQILQNNKLRRRLVKNGLKTAKKYDWKIIAKKYYDQLYVNLLRGNALK